MTPVRRTVITQIKRINTWRRVGLSWKAIAKTLGVNNYRTLAYAYHTRWLWRSEC